MTEPLPFACQITMGENADSLFDAIRENAHYATHMLAPTPNTKRGKRLVICGAGPSLHGYLTEWPRWFAHEVWACNSAVPFLMQQGARVTHAFGVDQTLGMLDDWQTVYPALQYYVASSIHPQLRDHLLRGGASLTWLHNLLGLPNPEGWPVPDSCWWCGQPNDEAHHGHDFRPLTHELWLYRTLYPPAVWAQYGLNAVGRALCVALWMGYQKIHIWGSDCGAIAPSRMPASDSPDWPAWMESVVMYADGRNARQVYTVNGALIETPIMQGRQWITRADMVMTAQHLITMIKWAKGRVVLRGDTLPGDLLAEGEASFVGTRALPTIEGEGIVTGMVLHPESGILQ